MNDNDADEICKSRIESFNILIQHQAGNVHSSVLYNKKTGPVHRYVLHICDLIFCNSKNVSGDQCIN